MVTGDEQSRPAIARQLSNLHQSPPPSKKPAHFTTLPGGRPALFAFGLSLVAYTLQTEAAQYVQQGLGYRKPFLSLYLGHSGFSVILPLHLLFLRYHTKLPYSHYFHIIAQNLHWQLSTPTRPVKGGVQENIRRRLSAYSRRQGQNGHPLPSDEEQQLRTSSSTGNRPSLSRPLSFQDSLSISHPNLTSGIPTPPPYINAAQRTFGFDLPRFILMLLILMGAITVPALSWYCAVPMTSMADITALYNTFSVWALVFSVWFFGEKWSRYKISSVLLACGGVIIVAYGGGEEGEHRRRPKELDPVYGKPSTTLSTSTELLASSSTSPISATSLPKVAEDPSAYFVGRAMPTVTPSILYFPSRTERGDATPAFTTQRPASSASNPLLGDFLALFGAITMAAYEMAFKLLGTLPDEEGQKKRWDPAQGGSVRSRSRSRDTRGNSISQAYEDEDEEVEGLLSEEQSWESGLSHSIPRGRKAGNHVPILSSEDDDAEEEVRLPPSSEDTAQPLPIDSTERSPIWSPPPRADPLSNDVVANKGPVDYGSGASSPFLSVEFGGFAGEVKKARSSSAEAQHRRREKGDEALNVEAINTRLSVASGSRRGGERQEDDRADDDMMDTESVLQSGDEEEILAGATRLGKSRPVSKIDLKATSKARGTKSVLFDQEVSYASDHDEDGEEDGYVGETHGRSHQGHPQESEARTSSFSDQHTWIPPPLPFGLHANIMTTGIGVVTASTLWLGVLIAHLVGWEPFEMPHNFMTVFALLFVVFAGVIFNACFMLLLALWGPVTASVSCLLSTVAVAIFDALLKGSFSVVSLLGCSFIVGGFGLLMLDEGGGGAGGGGGGHH